MSRIRRSTVAAALLLIAVPAVPAVAATTPSLLARVNGSDVAAAPAGTAATETADTANAAQRTAPSCAVLDPTGEPTTTVRAGLAGSPSYALDYRPGPPTSRVTFTVRPLSANSPLREQTQTFDISDDRETGITTPFGIPTWGQNRTAGDWVLVVRTSRGQTVRCPFTVVP